MKPQLPLTFALLALPGGCNQKAQIVSREEIIAAIQQAEQAQEAALARKDLDVAVNIFTEESTLYPPGMPPAHGRAAIKAVNEHALKDPALNVAIDEASRKWWVAASGDLATTTYTSVWTHTDTTSGKVLTESLVSQTTWAKQADGTWKNVWDMNAVYPDVGSSR